LDLADDIEKKIAQHMKKEQAKNGGSLNKREIARTISSLKKEYGIKMRRGRDMESMTTKFMDQLNSQRMRFKRMTKAEKNEKIVARKARK
jgi:predicted secreted Zn-dependent protease